MKGFEAGFQTLWDLVYFWSSLLPGYRYLGVSPKLWTAYWAPSPGEVLDSDFCLPKSCKAIRALLSFSTSPPPPPQLAEVTLILRDFNCSGHYLLQTLNLIILSCFISSQMPSSRFLKMILTSFLIVLNKHIDPHFLICHHWKQNSVTYYETQFLKGSSIFLSRYRIIAHCLLLIIITELVVLCFLESQNNYQQKLQKISSAWDGFSGT